MISSPLGSEVSSRSRSPESVENITVGGSFTRNFWTQKSWGTALAPSDPLRQEKRLPIRILKMLTAHSHILHPEYLQPLSSAPVSIELDAKKSPLALLAQTCSQIGKPDPPPSSKLASLSSNGLSDKDSSSSTRSSGSSIKSGDQHQSLDDKSSFKPYSKAGGGGDCRKDGLLNGMSDKAGFRVHGGSGGSVTCASFPPHATSPRTSSPPQHTPPQAHHRQQSQPSPTTATSLALSQKSSHAQSQYIDSSKAGSATAAADPGSGDSGSGGSNSSGGTVKKEPEQQHGSKADRLDHAQIANSSHARASANSSNASSASSPQPDSKAQDAQLPGQPGLTGPGHVAPVSPFKPGHSVFPLPPSTMGYHGSIVGAYAGYPSQFVPGLDPSKSGLVGAGMAGIPGKHPSSSPLTGASPPSFMQGLCRDPYCLTYPNAPHLGSSNCTTCVHDPSSTLKSAAGFPLMYPSHHLHSLHPAALSASGSTPSLSHPLYTYGFMLPNEPLPHACNWVSVGGPCDKRFATSEELLAHLRTHTALPGGVDSSKLLSAAAAAAYPSSVSSAASCHLHLPPPTSPGALPASFSLRGSPSLSLAAAARYHPYGKAHLPGAPPSLPPMHSLPGSAPYYSPYSLYSQRLGSASALGYQ